MKILQVISYFAPKFGGDVNVCYNISKKLVQLGHDVTIITTDYGFDPAFATQAETEGIVVKSFRTVVNLGFFIYTPSLNRWLAENIKDFQIIHLHNFRSYQNNCILRYAHKYTIPYILQPHGSMRDTKDMKFEKKMYDLAWGKRLLNGSSQVFALTSTEELQCQSMGVPSKKITIVPNGIDQTCFENLPERGLFRQSQHIPDDHSLILYLGRLHKSKGLDILVESIKELVTEKSGIQLILIGPDDGYLSELNRIITVLDLQQNVRIIGYVSQEEKLQAFVDSDVFVTPVFSGFPVSFLEACACGTPIVTTSDGDRLPWISNNVGLVVPNDIVRIKDAIATILNYHDLAQSFRTNGKELVKTTYNWHIITKEIAAAYTKNAAI